jgi:DNA polymerase III subunit gamma/tau
MSLDTKYRPHTFDDVLGQKATVQILRQFIATGTGYRQSYLFAGPFGSGKTTLGRILARGLLCENPTEQGDPCDQCDSCQSILEGGTHTDFTEVDAATNSGKADVKKLIEEIEFSTFSGRRRIYLFDESHQLSPNALDALLKPLEENLPGTEDKKLVCIFCTTEPEKMRATILSRCAPVFVIRPLPPEAIAKRLAFICDQEGLEYEAEMLPVIAELTECHIRDALKAVEGVSMLGALNRENVTSYLHLDLNDVYLDLLLGIGNDLGAAMKAAEQIMERASPLTCYEKLANVSMMAFKAAMGVEKPAAFWDATKMAALTRLGGTLLIFTSTFSSRPGRPTPSMLYCDIAQLHHGGGVKPLAVQPVLTVPVQTPSAAPQRQAPAPPSEPSSPQIPSSAGTVDEPSNDDDEDGVVVDRRAVRKLEPATQPTQLQALELDVDKFVWLLGLRVAELDEAGSSGQKGRSYMDRH